jgi:hypothetical protein
VAVGLAIFFQRIRVSAAVRRSLLIGFDVIAYLLAVLVLIVALGEKSLPYPSSGSASATSFVESEFGGRDVVLIQPGDQYSFAAESDFSIEIQQQEPKFTNPRIHVLPFYGINGQGFPFWNSDEISPAVRDARQVFVYRAQPTYPPALMPVHRAINSVGFKLQRIANFGTTRVEIWHSTASASSR